MYNGTGPTISKKVVTPPSAPVMSRVDTKAAVATPAEAESAAALRLLALVGITTPNEKQKLVATSYARLKKTTLTEEEGLFLLAGIEKPTAAQQTAAKFIVASKAMAKDVDWNQYALTHNTGLIAGSAFDNGVQVYANFKAYIDFISSMENNSFFALSHGDIKGVAKQLNAVLNDAFNVLKMLPQAIHGQYTDDTISNAADKFLTNIDAQLKRGYAYIPTGYVGQKVGKPGHAFSCEILQDKDNVTISFLNLGEGVWGQGKFDEGAYLEHPYLDVTKTGYKFSLSTHAVVMSNADWDKNKKEIISRFIRFQVDTPPDETPGYTTLELYDFLKSYGRVEPKFVAAYSLILMALVQYVGDCTEKSVRLIVMKFLRQHMGMSAKDVDRFFLNFFYTSLLSGYHAYMKAPSKQTHALMRDAADNYERHLEQLKASVSEKEYTETSEVYLLIKQITSDLPTPPKTNASVVKEPPAPCSFPKASVKPETLQVVMRDEVGKECNSDNTIPTTLGSSFEMPLNAADLKGALTNFVKELEKRKASMCTRQTMVDQAYSTFPIPKWGVKDYWDGVPENDIKPILQLLREVERYYHETGTSNYFSHYGSDWSLMKSAIKAAVLDKLVRRLKETKLEGYATPFELGSHDQYFTLENPAEDERYLAIKSYFEACQKASPGKTIFPLAGKLYLANFVKEKTNNIESVGANHLRYLDQFSGELKTASDYATFWMSQKWPQEVMMLYNAIYQLHDVVHSGFATRELEFHVNETEPEVVAIQNFHSYDDDDIPLFREMKVVRHFSDNEPLLYAHTHASELFYKMRHKNLTVPTAFIWMRKNFTHLSNSNVQRLLKCCFFAPGALHYHLQHERDQVIKEFRALIKEGFALHREREDRLAILFLIRLGITFESYVSYTSGPKPPPLDQTVLTEYREKLLSLQKLFNTEDREHEESALDIQMHLIYLESFLSVHSFDDTIARYTRIFNYRTRSNTNNNGWIPSSGFYPLAYHGERAAFHLFGKLKSEAQNNPVLLNRFGNEVMKSLLGNEAGPPLQWKLDGETLVSDQFILGLRTGQINHPKRQLSLHRPNAFYRSMSVYQFERFNLPSDSLWWRARALDKKDALFCDILIKPDESKALVSRDATGQGELVPFSKIHGRELPLIHGYVDPKTLKDVAPLAHCQTHQIQSVENGKTTLLSYIDKKPFVQTEFTDKETIVSRVDENGKSTSIKAVNLANLATSHSLYASTLQYAPADQQLCFVNERDEIEELYFRRLGLSFKRKGGSLESIEYPGYNFVPGMRLKALGEHSKSALILKNSFGKYKVLLLFPSEESRLLGKCYEEWVQKGGKDPNWMVKIKTYYTFDLLSSEEMLSGTTLDEKLFLSFFFKAAGDMTRALEELQRADQPLPMNERVLFILVCFLHLQDKTPQALAYNMKLVHFFCNRYSAISTTCDYFRRDEWLSKTTSWYISYLRALEEIPPHLRLSYGDERRILATFHREGFDLTKHPYYKILSIRKDLVAAAPDPIEVQFTKEEVPLFPRVYEGIPKPTEVSCNFAVSSLIGKDVEKHPEIKHPSFVTLGYLLAHYPTLLERAKSNTLGADLLALLRFRAETLTRYQRNKWLVHFLFYVNCFPEAFSNVTLVGVKDATEIENILMIILNRVVHELEKRADYKEVMDKVLAKREFDYTPQKSLALPGEGEQVQLKGQKGISNFEKKPLAAISNALFTVEATPLPATKGPLFNPAYFPQPTHDERQLLDKFEKDNVTLRGKTRPAYKLKANALNTAAATLSSKQNILKATCVRLAKEIDSALNDPFNAFASATTNANEKEKREKLEREFRVQMETNLIIKISAEDVMRKVILEDDMNFLIEHRKMLSEDQRKMIVDLVTAYYHESVVLSQVDEALEQTKAIERDQNNQVATQRLGELLNYSYDYDPVKFPEIDYFRMMTGKLPRPDQLESYMWVCEGLELGENRMFQLPAGGGKTTFLIPLLILRALRHKMLPLVYTTQAIFEIEKANLAEILKQLKLKLNTVDIGMQTQLDAKQARRHLQDLLEAKRRGEAVIMVPQNFYAIRLFYLIASCDLSAESQEKAKILGLILKLFKESALQLMDESHRNADPMTQAIYGVGNFEKLGLRDSLLSLELMKPLFVHDPLSGVDPIFASRQALAPSAAQLSKTMVQLSKYMAPSLLKKLHPKFHDPFIKFWSDPKGEKPELFGKLPEEDQQLVLLMRYVLQSLLPSLGSMQTDLDHLRSNNVEVDAPSHHKVPSFALFENPYFAWLLTIKGAFHRSLERWQVHQLIGVMREKSETERNGKGDTHSEQTFASFVPASLKRQVTLINAFEIGKDDFIVLSEAIRVHPKAIEYYLHNWIRGLVGYPSEQVTVTPAHLVTSPKVSMSFSATPMIKEAHPKAIAKEKRDPLFEAEVVAKCREFKRCISSEQSKFFDAIGGNKQEEYKNVRALIDLGYLHDDPNDVVAEKWLKASSLDGVLYFDQKRNDKLTLLFKAPEKVTKFFSADEMERAGHDLRNLKWTPAASQKEAENLIKDPSVEIVSYLDSEREGARTVLIKEKYKKFYFEGGNDSLAREMALEGYDYHKMKIGTYYDAAHAESANIIQIVGAEAIVTCGEMMDLSHFIQAVMRMRGLLLPHMKQSLIWALPPALKARMTIPGVEFDIEAILAWAFKNLLRERKDKARMAASQAKSLDAEQTLLSKSDNPQQTIQKNAPLFKEKVEGQKRWVKGSTTTGIDPGLCKQMHQNVIKVVKQHRKRIQYAHNLNDYEAEKVQPHAPVTDPNYLKSLVAANLVSARYSLTEATENFYVEPNQFNTVKKRTTKESIGSKFRKEIDFILVTIDETGKYYAEAHSNEVMNKVVAELRSGTGNPQIKHKAFIMRIDGVAAQRGTGALAPGEALVAQVKASKWMKKVLADAKFINATPAYDEDGLFRQMEWKSFKSGWQATIEAFPHREHNTVDDIHEYLSAMRRPAEQLILNF